MKCIMRKVEHDAEVNGSVKPTKVNVIAQVETEKSTYNNVNTIKELLESEMNCVRVILKDDPNTKITYSVDYPDFVII